MELKKGFYPALGTPVDKDGNVLEDSYRKQIELMINAGASGALCMGSMGTEVIFTLSQYKEVARVACEAVNGRIPLFIGAMDNSVQRVKERVEAIRGFNYDGLVLTTPFYSTFPSDILIKYFKECADVSDKPVYLYDLPVITKQKITYAMCVELAKHPNIKGIKTGDIVLARLINNNLPGFDVLFSNLDAFDVAGAYGLPRVLDGMFTCVPKNSELFHKAYVAGDIENAKKYLDNIVGLRDLFIGTRLWSNYKIAMNLIGLEGDYGYGFGTSEETPGDTEKVTAFMKKIGEI